MHRIDNPTASTSLPIPKPAGPDGYFTAGNVATGLSPTIVEYDWLNTIQEELMNVVLRGGMAPDKSDNTQLLRALSALFTGATTQITVTQNVLVPPWATKISFRLVGSGAGAGHCQSNGTTYIAGAGGGSGAYVEAQRNVTPGSLLTGIVGVGGGNEVAGQTTSLAFPGQWTVSAGGGFPAVWTQPQTCAGGQGGTPAAGDLMSSGNFGGDGQVSVSNGPTGYGGPGPWGGGPRAGHAGGSGNPGAPGAGPGAGGGGVYDTGSSGVRANGGPGANGLIQYRFLP